MCGGLARVQEAVGQWQVAATSRAYRQLARLEAEVAAALDQHAVISKAR